MHSATRSCRLRERAERAAFLTHSFVGIELADSDGDPGRASRRLGRFPVSPHRCSTPAPLPSPFDPSNSSGPTARPLRRRAGDSPSFSPPLSAADPLDHEVPRRPARPNRPGPMPLPVAMAGLLSSSSSRARLSSGGSVWWSWDVGSAWSTPCASASSASSTAFRWHFTSRETVGGTMNRIEPGNQRIRRRVQRSRVQPPAHHPLPRAVGVRDVPPGLAARRRRHRLHAGPGPHRARAAPEQIRRERRLVERWSSIYGRFNEVLAGMMTVKGFDMEDAEKRRFLEGVREGNEVFRRGVRTDGCNGALRNLAATVARLAALALGGYLAFEGQIGPRHSGGLPGLHRRPVRAGPGAHQHLSVVPEGDGLAGKHLRDPGCGGHRGRRSRRGPCPAAPGRGAVPAGRLRVPAGSPVLRDIDLTVASGRDRGARRGRAAAGRPRS